MIVSYKIDVQDRLCWVNQEWSTFALQNGGGDLAGQGVLGTSLWDHIEDDTTACLYELVLKKIRSKGVTLTFRMQCDSPDCERVIDLSGQADGQEVRFDCRIISEKRREPVMLLASLAPRSGNCLRMCGWCKRISVKDVWLDTEQAIRELGLFRLARLPLITHGICPTCYHGVLDELQRVSG